MNRKGHLKKIMLFFGTIILVLTAFEYLVQVYSITIDTTLAYSIEIFYLVSIFVFLVSLVIFLNPESPKKDMS